MELKSRKPALKPILTTNTSTTITGGDNPIAGGEEHGEPLSPAGRLFHTRRFNCVIVAVMGFRTVLSPDVFKDGLKRTLLKHPRFSSKLVGDSINGGKMRWVPTTVNLDDHVIVPKLDPSRGSSPDEIVSDYVTGISSNPLDPSRPLWDFHLLNIKTSDAESVAVLRVHHSIGDGASLISLLLACTRKSSDPDAVPTIPSSKRSVKTSRDRFGGVLWILVAIWSAMRLIWNTFVDLVMFLATIVFLKDSATPIKGEVSVEFKPKLFVHRIVSLEDIKLVKLGLNSTINDVVLGITQAGLSRYLNRKFGKYDTKGEAKHNKTNLPENIRLRSIIMVNIRPTAGIQDLADMMAKESKTKWGNGIGYIILPFTIGLQDDPLDYVRTAKAMIDRKKFSLEAVCSYSVALFILKSFGLNVAAALTHRITTNITMAFSNIVGPQEEVIFYGHPLAYIAPSVYGHPQALTFHYQSYANKMIISVTVDPDVIPDPYQLCDDLENSLKSIKKAAIDQGLIKDTA